MIYGVEDSTGKRKRTKCLCRCDCGNTKTVAVDNLKSGNTISCGCDTSERRIQANRKDLTGQRFGRLVVKEMLWDYRPTRCVCECDCGATTIVIGTGLTSGKTQSCGCYHRDRTIESNTKDWTDVVSDYGVSFIKREYQNDKGQWMWRCRCGLCGKEFVALPAKVMNGHITSCGCRRQSSREQLIQGILSENNIDFQPQYSLPDCKFKQRLFFDFAIFQNGAFVKAIEYDGRQHATPIEFFGGNDAYRRTVARDQAKDRYCAEHNIELHRLPYTMTDTEIRKKVMNIIYP